MFMSQYGKVSTGYKKGNHRDMVDGTPGFIWDRVWQVNILVTDGLVLPMIILAPRGNWRLKHRDSRFLCYKCGSPSHAWWACRAQPRLSVEDIPEWHIDLGDHVDRNVLPNFVEGASVKEMGQELNDAIRRSREIGRGSARSTRPTYMRNAELGLEHPTETNAEDATAEDVEVTVVPGALVAETRPEVVSEAGQIVGDIISEQVESMVVEETPEVPVALQKEPVDGE